MANGDLGDIDKPPDFRAQGEQLGMGATEPKVLERQGVYLLSWLSEAVTWLVEFALTNTSKVAIWFAERIITGEDRSALAFRQLTRTAIQDLTGSDPGAGHRAIGRTIMDALSGGPGAAPGGQLQPSTEGAEAYMEMVMQLALEGYIEGGITSALSAGFLDKFTELDDILSSVLGLGRMSRAVMRPMMTARVITPMQWHTNKLYRPELLAAGAAVEAFLRGDYTGPQLTEELARQGWSDARIDILIANATKRLTLDHLMYLHFRGAMPDTDVIAGARRLGYDEITARTLFEIETAKRRDRWFDPVVDEAVSRFLAGDIERLEFERAVRGAAPSVTEADNIIAATADRVALRRRRLSPAEVRGLVIDGILSVVDYRRALERERFALEDVAALELALRKELDAQKDLEKARAAQAAEREAEKAAAAADKARRAAELEARKALPALTEYRRAFVRGIITRDRFAAALLREKVAITPDDLAVLLEDADADRATFVANEAKRAEAEARQVDPTLSVAKSEEAVLRGVITLADFDSWLASQHYAEDERRILVTLLQGRLEDQDRARAERAAAADRAALSAISLPAFERAVRLGVRTMDQYAALLTELAVPEVARVLVLDLLRATMAQDAAARDKRAALEAAGAVKGLSLGQRRRAVVAGVRPRSYYEAALVAAGWPVDDQLVELALVDLELEEAAAARARRDAIAAELEAKRLEEEERRRQRELEAAQPPPPPTLTLAQIERAVKLGLVPPEALRQYLYGRGYETPDVELLVALVVADIPDVRSGQALEDRVEAELKAKGVSLADLKAAVRRGIRSLEDYAATLAGQGYGEDDTALLVQLLREEIAADFTGLRAKVDKALAGTEGAPALAEIDAAFAAGELDAAAVADVLTMFGAPTDSALVYSRLLEAFGSEA